MMLLVAWPIRWMSKVKRKIRKTLEKDNFDWHIVDKFVFIRCMFRRMHTMIWNILENGSDINSLGTLLDKCVFIYWISKRESECLEITVINNDFTAGNSLRSDTHFIASWIIYIRNSQTIQCLSHELSVRNKNTFICKLSLDINSRNNICNEENIIIFCIVVNTDE